MCCDHIDTRIYNNYLIISLNPDHISGPLCTNVKSPSDLLPQQLIFLKVLSKTCCAECCMDFEKSKNETKQGLLCAFRCGDPTLSFKI